jgi:hypothetical protein
LNEKNTSPDYVAVEGVVPILETLTTLKAITAPFPTLADPPVVVDQASSQIPANYQCSMAMALSQLMLKAQNVKLAPRDIAAKIVNTVILVRPKTGESAQLSFTPKFVGEFFSIWANFVQIGKISPENFWGKILLRVFTHFEKVSPKKKITVKCLPPS